jgi:hypothetical protein
MTLVSVPPSPTDSAIQGQRYAPANGVSKTPRKPDRRYTPPLASLGNDLVAASQLWEEYGAAIDYLGIGAQVCDETVG